MATFFRIQRKILAQTFSCGHAGLKTLFLRLFALPLAMCLMWAYYNKVGDDAKGFYSKSGLILNVLGLAYGTGAWVTISLCKYLEYNFGLTEAHSSFSTYFTYLPTCFLPFSSTLA